MQGRRLPDDCTTGLMAGDYGRVTLAGEEHWHVCMPNGSSGILGESHQVTEHPDGSISVWPSILDRESGWHGHLVGGYWSVMAQ